MPTTLEASYQGFDVLVLTPYRVAPEQARRVRAFVQAGGGLLAAATGWGWQQGSNRQPCMGRADRRTCAGLDRESTPLDAGRVRFRSAANSSMSGTAQPWSRGPTPSTPGAAGCSRITG